MSDDKWTKDYFEKEFKEPDPWRFSTSSYEQTKYRRQIDLVRDLVSKPAEILEIGCAEGVHTKMLAEAFPTSRITAIDISDRALERAKQNPSQYNGVRLERADVIDFISTAKDGQFDVIVWSESIYYLGDGLTLRGPLEFLERVVAKLRKNGICCMANIIGQPDAPEIPLTRRPLMECYYHLLSSVARPVHRSTYLEHKAESGCDYDYQIWAFKRT